MSVKDNFMKEISENRNHTVVIFKENGNDFTIGTADLNTASHLFDNEDGKFKPLIKIEDTNEMAALKFAIAKKGINIEDYKVRFGSSYENDIRIIENNSDITLQKLKDICGKLDVDAILTFKDKPEASNPIGCEITTYITNPEDNNDTNEDYDDMVDALDNDDEE